MRRHVLDVAHARPRFVGYLLVRELESHEIQAQNPDFERLMMSRQHRVGEIVEPNRAIPAEIALPEALRVVVAVAHDLFAAAPDTPHALRPTRLANEFETFGFVEQACKIDEGVHGSNLG